MYEKSMPQPLGVAFLLLLLLCSNAYADVEIGQPAPKLVVTRLDGETFDLSAQHGKIVIVSFWATWCPPCRQEMPILDAIYHRYHAQGLEVIGLSVDRSRHLDDVRAVMHAFSYPAAMLDDASTNDFGDPASLPVTYIIDISGVIRARLTPDESPFTEEALNATVSSFLLKGSK